MNPKAGFLSRGGKTYLFQVTMHLQCPSAAWGAHRVEYVQLCFCFQEKAIPKWCYHTNFSGVTRWVQSQLSQTGTISFQVLYIVEVVMVVQIHLMSWFT